MANTGADIINVYASSCEQAWMDAYSYFGYGVKVILLRITYGEYVFTSG